MSQPANTLRFDLALGATFFDVEADQICRDEACQELSLHTIDSGACRRRRPRDKTLNTRSRIFAAEPWRAYCSDALRDSVYAAVSLCEPRNFSTVLRFVENDYGSCCERSVHRHLVQLRSEGTVVRMDFKGRVHAYLRAGSRLLSDPGLVFEQIMNLHACEAA